MSYTPIFATTSDIELFAKGTTAQDFDLTSLQFTSFLEIIHALVESHVAVWLNRSTTIATDLAASAQMTAVCKYAVIEMVVNSFVHFKAKRAGQVATSEKNSVDLYSPDIFTEDIQKILRPFRVGSSSAITPETTLSSFSEG